MSIRDCPRLLPDLYGETVDALWRVGADGLCELEESAEKLVDMTDAKSVDARYLDAMAQDRQTYFADLAKNEAQRRALIADTMAIHRKKGTAWAMKTAFAALGLDARPKPWHAYDGEPYHYRVEIATKDIEITPELLAKTERMAEEMASLRDVSDGVDLAYLCDTTVDIACGAVGEVYAECEHIEGYTIDAHAMLFGGAGVIGEVHTNIGGDT